MRQQIERIFTGRETNQKIRKLQQKQQKLRNTQNELGEKVTIRPKTTNGGSASAQFDELYKEVATFTRNFAEISRVTGMIDTLSSQKRGIETWKTVVDQEAIWQVCLSLRRHAARSVTIFIFIFVGASIFIHKISTTKTHPLQRYLVPHFRGYLSTKIRYAKTTTTKKPILLATAPSAELRESLGKRSEGTEVDRSTISCAKQRTRCARLLGD